MISYSCLCAPIVGALNLGRHETPPDARSNGIHTHHEDKSSYALQFRGSVGVTPCVSYECLYYLLQQKTSPPPPRNIKYLFIAMDTRNQPQFHIALPMFAMLNEKQAMDRIQAKRHKSVVQSIAGEHRNISTLFIIPRERKGRDMVCCPRATFLRACGHHLRQSLFPLISVQHNSSSFDWIIQSGLRPTVSSYLLHSSYRAGRAASLNLRRKHRTV